MARRIEKVEALSKKLASEKGKVHAFKCDMTNENDIVNVVKLVSTKLGPIHILINNAGLSQKASLLKGETSAWKTVLGTVFPKVTSYCFKLSYYLDTNILGLNIATREVVQNMTKYNTAGHIVNMNSILGHQVLNIPGLDGVYTASKFAVTALTETLRMELDNAKLPIKTTVRLF